MYKMLLLLCLIPLYWGHAPTAQVLQVLVAKGSYLQPSPKYCLWLMGIDSTDDVWGVTPLSPEATH